MPEWPGGTQISECRMPPPEVLTEFGDINPEKERRGENDICLCIKADTNIVPSGFGLPMVMVSYFAVEKMAQAGQLVFNLCISGEAYGRDPVSGAPLWKYYGTYQVVRSGKMINGDFTSLEEKKQRAIISSFRNQQFTEDNDRAIHPVAFKAIKLLQEQGIWNRLEDLKHWSDCEQRIRRALEDGSLRLPYFVAFCVGFDVPFAKYLKNLDIKR